MDLDVKPIDIFDYPQTNPDVFKEIESYAREKLEVARFPEIITIDKQRLNLDTNIRLKNNEHQRARTPTKLFKVKTPEHTRSLSSSFRANANGSHTHRQEFR